MVRRKSSTIQVRIDAPIREGVCIVRRAWLGIDDAPQDLWFRIPADQAENLSTSADAFAVAVTFVAMRTRRPVHIHGPVSRSLLAGLHDFQNAWAQWRPDELAVAEITATQDHPPPRGEPRRTVTTFSGGVDSAYTARSHAAADRGPSTRPLTCGLFVHGLDIPLSAVTAFDRAADANSRMLESIDLTLVPLATNFRSVLDRHAPWEDTFGTALASCLLLFERGFDTGLVPSSYRYRDLRLPYGSNPITDPMLGTAAMRITHDGAHLGRLQKVDYVSDWTEAREHLRVCWSGPDPDRNCCRCEKCIRTILTFRIAGAGLPATFSSDCERDQIKRLRVRGSALDALGFLADAARDRCPDEAWVGDLVRTVRRNRIRQQAGRTKRRLVPSSPDRS